MFFASLDASRSPVLCARAARCGKRLAGCAHAARMEASQRAASISYDISRDRAESIRDAVVEDAPAACEVLRRSILELCVADHGNYPTILARWLSNKTPDIVASWIEQAGNCMLVAVEGRTILGVSSVTDKGEINLNYVSPDARFRGISRALTSALEARAMEHGNVRCALISTETARRFYLSAGYIEDGPPVRKFWTWVATRCVWRSMTLDLQRRARLICAPLGRRSPPKADHRKSLSC